MEVKIYNRTFFVEGYWTGQFYIDINEKPEYIVGSITLEGREILNLIYNKPLYFKIVEMAANS